MNNKFVTIFEIAKVNGGEYRGENLPSNQWKWPESTWLKKRLEEQRNVLASRTQRETSSTD